MGKRPPAASAAAPRPGRDTETGPRTGLRRGRGVPASLRHPPPRLCNTAPHPQRRQRGGHRPRQPQAPHGAPSDARIPAAAAARARGSGPGGPSCEAGRASHHLRGRGLIGAAPVPSLAARGRPPQGRSPRGDGGCSLSQRAGWRGLTPAGRKGARSNPSFEETLSSPSNQPLRQIPKVRY